MKILISEIPDEGLDLKIDELLETDVLRLTSPVRGNLNITKVGPEVVIRGEIAAAGELECSRCLKNYKAEVLAPIDVMYHPVDELKVEGKHEVRDDELDTGFYIGDDFDLLELLKEQVVLNIPMKPLCSDACMGICPKCGSDLNIKKCKCDLN